MTVKVLFVCLGNICRSPMAEGLMRQYADRHGLELLVDSAATSRWEVGNPPHLGTQKVLREAGVDFSQMRGDKLLVLIFMILILLSLWIMTIWRI